MNTFKKAIGRIAGATVVPLLALILIFEEWGWEPLARMLGILAKLPVWSQIERLILRLPPYAALLTFMVPVLALIPVKLLAWYWVAQGHTMLGLSVVLGAKVLGTAIIARLFTVTQPALMQLSWFASLYWGWKRWKDRIIARVRCSPQWLAFVVRRRRLARQVRCALLRLRRSFSAYRPG
ncbi:MAG: hypothetical protein H7332_01310 [Bdellovibrionales bacterium]|nr:hypothetical protein [Ramlibacter sp.]